MSQALLSPKAGGARPPGLTPRRNRLRGQPRKWRSAGAFTQAVQLCLLLAAVSCAAPPEPEARPRSLVLVTVSDLRADAVETSSLLRDAPIAVAPSSLDVQSVASIATGRWPTRAGAIGIAEAQPPEDAPTLAGLLRRRGYASAWISQSAWGQRPGFTRGFEWVETAPDSGWSDDETVRRTLNAARALVADAGEVPVFVAVHFAPPLDIGPDALEVLPPQERWTTAYRNAVAERLRSLDGLIAGLEEVLGPERTAEAVWAVAGVSGFELGEHGGLGSGWTAQPESIRVPLHLRFPGPEGPTAADLSAPISLADLTPTFLAAAGIDPEAPVDDMPLAQAFDGRPLLRWTEDRTALVETVADPERIVLSELVVRERSIQRALLNNHDGRLLHYLHVLREIPTADRAAVARGYEELQAAMLSGATESPPLFGEAVREVLHDLTSDPEARRPVFPAEAGDLEPALRQLRSALRAYAALTEEHGYQIPTITRRLELDPDQMRELESLGYL